MFLVNDRENFQRALGLLLVALAAGPAWAQKLSPQNLPKSSPKIVALFTEVAAKPSQSTVRVQCNGKDVILGTVVAADGWILTKASELKKGAAVRCKLKDGRELDAGRTGTDDKFDLALLKVDAKDLTPVEWSDSKETHVGRWIACVGVGAEPVAIGVVSVAARKLTGPKVAPTSSSGYVGVVLDTDFAGVRISLVADDSPAKKDGLKADDQILAINGEAVASPDEFLSRVYKLKAGEVVTFKLLRDEEELELQVTLGKRPRNNRGDVQNSMGSQLSERRTGFPIILQHDSVLKPSDCGGPLVDLNGRVIGLNIARAGRTESYAIPGEVVRALFEKLKADKETPPAKTETPADEKK